eukprot:CAMPEP_0194239828 /NCGR_PEP_ID=MMETSP0158-20130606/6177_1 /TAXON_ID=33649 /ORGANISM="Thalassionema nitzschioides, Strain L26-B" /LENGTH=304 /DNA_ID=CAMNT_0038974391 /DNA_START=58 /DNA_END=972 /DNA_ORIENTATION=-
MAVKLSHMFLVLLLASTSIFDKCSGQVFPGETTRILLDDQQTMSMDYSIFPSSTPSIRRSTTTSPSDQPSQTINPTRSPSGAPTVSVSGFPTDQPSVAPSDTPSRTINPSRSPSTAPTGSSTTSLLPSPSVLHSVVQLQLLFSITIGINPSEVPSDPTRRIAFVNVIEASFVEVTPGQVSNVNVILPDGVRMLQQDDNNDDDFLDIGVELVTNQACRVEDCEQFSDTVLENVQQEIDAEILAEAINLLAQANDVTALATASVLDYQLMDQTILIDGTSYASSSPSRTYTMLASVVVALVTSFFL